MALQVRSEGSLSQMLDAVAWILRQDMCRYELTFAAQAGMRVF